MRSSIFVLLALLSACGGSSDGSSSTASTTSTTESSTTSSGAEAEAAPADPWASRNLRIPGELASRADVIAALDPLLPEAHACLVAAGSAEPAVGSVVSVILFTGPDGAAQNVNLGWRVADEEILAASGRERGDAAGCLTAVLARAHLPASESGIEVDFDLP